MSRGNEKGGDNARGGRMRGEETREKKQEEGKGEETLRQGDETRQEERGVSGGNKKRPTGIGKKK